MNLVIPKYDINICFKENYVNTLIIENPDAFRFILSSLYNQCNGNDGSLILSEEDKILKISKEIELITNIFEVDCNSRKLINAVYKELNEMIYEVKYEEVSKLNGQIIDSLEDFFSLTPLPLEFDLDLDLSNLFKIYKTRVYIDDEKDSLSYLFDYLKLMHDVCKVEIFVILNLKSYFDKNELDMFIRNLNYEKIHLLILEGVESPNSLDNEIKLILDKDLCKINI